MSQTLAPRLQSSLGTRAADTRPNTWREDDLSIEAIAATEHPTRMRIYDYDTRRYADYDEILDVSALTDAEIAGFVGCPVLDSHSAWSTMTVVGVIDECRREGTQLVVRFRLSKTEDDIVSKVRDGILRKVSVGYQRKTGAVITERDGDVPLRRQPFVPAELSLVAIAADPNAGTRSGEALAALNPPAPVIDPKEPTMRVDAIRSAMTAFTTAMTAALAETPATDTGQRAANPVTPATPAPVVAETPAPVAPASPAAPVAGQRSAEDTALITGLRGIANAHGRTAEFDALAAAGEPVDGLRSLAKSYATTARVETNSSISDAGQRSADKFISHGEAVDGRRSGNDGVSVLAEALAALAKR